MEADSKKKGRPPLISNEEKLTLLARKGLTGFYGDRWALDQRFKETALEALRENPNSCPFILAKGKRPKVSLLVELGRWGDARAIRIVARNIEEYAFEKKDLTVKEAASICRQARLTYQRSKTN